MNIRYKVLFSIEILNDYFSSGKWKETSFIPLPETSRLLASNGLQLRKVQNQLLVITRVDKDMKPLRLPDFYSKFSFILAPESPNYINFTNLPFPESRLKCFHFHNMHNNVAGTVNYLSSVIPDYSGTASYKPGDFARGSDSKNYESIKINNGDQLPDDTTAGSKKFWVSHGDLQYVNERDTVAMEAENSYEIKCTGPVFNFFTSVKRTTHNVNVFAYNFSSGAFVRQVYSDLIKFDDAHDIVQVDMRSLASGMYKIKVEDEINYVYLVSSGIFNDAPVFIDIFHMPETDPRTLLKPDGTLKNIKYTIRFASRRVYWRYKTRTNIIDNIKDSSGDFKFKADGLKFFISEKPIPFYDTPRKTFSANSGNLVISTPLPNPMADRLLNKRDEIYTTEISVNY